MPVTPFDPVKLQKEISRFNAKLGKLGNTKTGKAMLSNVADFTGKISAHGKAGTASAAKFTNAAQQTIGFIRLLPKSLLSSPDSPTISQESFVKSATEDEWNSSLLTLYLGTQALISGGSNKKNNIDYLLQTVFGRDKASLSIRDELTRPFEPLLEIPEFIKDTIKQLEDLVRAGNTRQWLTDGMKCMGKSGMPALWRGIIVNVTIKGKPCAGGSMIIEVENFQPDSGLQLWLPIEERQSLVLNIDEEILNGNIQKGINPDNSNTTLTIMLPGKITSGDLYFNVPGNQNPACKSFWSVMEPPHQRWQIIAGRPVIESFTVTQAGPIYPREYIDLNWKVINADNISIEILQVPGSPAANELPAIPIISNQPDGTIHVSIPCTQRWQGQYVMNASNACSLADPKTILLDSGWSDFLIGTGIANVTDSTRGLGMQGFADDLQKTTEVETGLFSRAFIIAKNKINPGNSDRTAIVIVDIWSCTLAIKTEVVNQLNDPVAHPELNGLYTTENVLISGTHTHSGPGGYSHYFLYNYSVGGFDGHNFNIIVGGIVDSIVKAHRNLAPGRIYVNNGDVVGDCGKNRSQAAYDANPDGGVFPGKIDKNMVLLKFVKDSNGQGNPYEIGTLNWYAIHATSRGQSNTSVSGDNKGWASRIYENERGTNYSAPETFVAGFATGCAGDISGSLDNMGNVIPHDSIQDVVMMQDYGNKQYEEANALFQTAVEEITGGIDFRYMHLRMSDITIENMANARTWPAAIGVSFGAGSTEDSKATTFLLGLNLDSPIREGINTGNITLLERASSVAGFAGLQFKLADNPLASDGPWNLPELDPLNIDPNNPNNSAFIAGHDPKPIMFPVGNCQPFPLVPNVVPIQLIKLGQLVIAGVPGEFTTMSGKRLKDTLQSEFGNPANRIIVANYANAYSGYITTEEEYGVQDYEGASTLYGPHTLAAYRQEFSKLARAMVTGNIIDPGSPESVNFVNLSRRGIADSMIYVTNKTASTVNIQIFNTNDPGDFIAYNTPHFDVPGNENLLFDVPTHPFYVSVNNQPRVPHNGGDIIIIP